MFSISSLKIVLVFSTGPLVFNYELYSRGNFSDSQGKCFSRMLPVSQDIDCRLACAAGVNMDGVGEAKSGRKRGKQRFSSLSPLPHPSPSPSPFPVPPVLCLQHRQVILLLLYNFTVKLPQDPVRSKRSGEVTSCHSADE